MTQSTARECGNGGFEDEVQSIALTEEDELARPHATSSVESWPNRFV